MAYSPVGGVQLSVVPLKALMEREETERLEQEPTKPAVEYDALTSWVINQFNENKRAREESDIEEEIKDGLLQFQGEYTDKDKLKLQQEGGSRIFMNITATKARAAKSWIADILLPPKGSIWEYRPTPKQDLPEDITNNIREAIEQEFEELVKPEPQPGQEGAQPTQEPQAGTPLAGQPIPEQTGQTEQSEAPQKGMGIEQAQMTIREQNQKRRDIENAFRNEINAEALHQLKKMQTLVEDQLGEGGWQQALLDFLDDFVIFPTAFMKGPIIQKGKRLTWAGGKAVETEKFIFKNERVDPRDIYPSAEQTCINDGNMIEHMRLGRGALESLIGVESYNDDNIREVLKNFDSGNSGSWVDTGIEQEKAEQEMRGSFIDTSRNIIHAMHFWGRIPVAKLNEWDLGDKTEGKSPEESVECEVLLAGDKVIKCIANDDPLLRRPYYKASFINRPGSFWGRSLPKVMESHQRMCNATARALANNLAIASGPQVELYHDRLADAGDIASITPMRIWQLKSDPTGAGGRAITFFQPTSNAAELLKVYNEFEMKADDVTGIPRYAYGNEKTAGATNTAQGLAMLLESTSKVIKDCIRNIDEGLIVNRMNYQFYYNMLDESFDFDYTGDVHVSTIGSQTLSLRGAEASRRNEFLQATANPTDIAIMGIEVRGDILREMMTDLGLKNVKNFPTALELRQQIKKDEVAQAQAAQAAQEAEREKNQVGLQATKLQVDGQAQMHQGTLQKDMAKLQADMQKFMKEYELKLTKLMKESDRAEKEEEGRQKRANTEAAIKLQSEGEGRRG